MSCKVVQDNNFGAWRSSVAHLLWEQGVAGSNPAAPIEFVRHRRSHIARRLHGSIGASGLGIAGPGPGILAALKALGPGNSRAGAPIRPRIGLWYVPQGFSAVPTRFPLVSDGFRRFLCRSSPGSCPVFAGFPPCRRRVFAMSSPQLDQDPCTNAPSRDGTGTPHRRDVARGGAPEHIDRVGLDPRRRRRGDGPPGRHLPSLRSPLAARLGKGQLCTV